MARLTWVRAVSGLIPSSWAISWLDRPVATHETISRSRSVSSAKARTWSGEPHRTWSGAPARAAPPPPRWTPSRRPSSGPGSRTLRSPAGYVAPLGLVDVLRALGVGSLVLGMWAMTGYFLGTVARGPALSVGLGLVWALVVENLLRGVGTLLGPVETLTHVLPGTAAGSLVGSIIGVGSDTPGVLVSVSGTQALVSVAAYAVLLPVIAVLVVRRRDLAG